LNKIRSNLLPDLDVEYDLSGFIFRTVYLHKGSSLIKLFKAQGYKVITYRIVDIIVER